MGAGKAAMAADHHHSPRWSIFRTG